MEVKIFVEGIADMKFIKDYISQQYNYQLAKQDIVETNGWTSIYSEGKSELLVNQMNSNTANEGVNILLFDADLDYAERLKQIEEWKKKLNLEFEIFLWPNNSDTGDLEKVLENIINQNNSAIFDCWDIYENCLSSKTIIGRGIPLTIPAKKTKIYGYLEALVGETKSQKEKIKERNRDYKDANHWDLNSDTLIPLKEFLNPFFL
ncbi:MAG: hypothetical protein PF517_20270 [Salinivirgaceae bacterium]|jgi:hypothetical protein|nr:hypothetical protein [Salinivirgaceae bacterium]